eukprot:scaffold24196_cov120-Isochrysis_galbana.AAC.1
MEPIAGDRGCGVGCEGRVNETWRRDLAVAWGEAAGGKGVCAMPAGCTRERGAMRLLCRAAVVQGGWPGKEDAHTRGEGLAPQLATGLRPSGWG